VDFLEAADRGAVEADALGEQIPGHLRQRDREVLPKPGQIGEAQIDDLDAVVLDQIDEVGGTRGTRNTVAAGRNLNPGFRGHGLLL
jgi:hypothetical protein